MNQMFTLMAKLRALFTGRPPPSPSSSSFADLPVDSVPYKLPYGIFKVRWMHTSLIL
ncbi:unnamed protein product [Gongylonema pulchrum]|uniref:Ovule protein n=1 Tax=Gongylonema pulchrum TaxID=637853 RepID=A0A183E350_9BILA|nr:unnamed protein product [Gongylonema pulchrum]